MKIVVDGVMVVVGGVWVVVGAIVVGALVVDGAVVGGAVLDVTLVLTGADDGGGDVDGVAGATYAVCSGARGTGTLGAFSVGGVTTDDVIVVTTGSMISVVVAGSESVVGESGAASVPTGPGDCDRSAHPINATSAM